MARFTVGSFAVKLRTQLEPMSWNRTNDHARRFSETRTARPLSYLLGTIGGECQTRTDYLLLAKQTLFPVS